MTVEMSQHVRVGFSACGVDVTCDAPWLAAELRARLPLAPYCPLSARVVLRIVVSTLDTDWIDVRDSTGRHERGSLVHALYHVRKWITSAFVDARPELLWLHAAAAARGGSALVIAGAAGSGKSTLVAELLRRSWALLADDAAAIERQRGIVLPLPISPETRVACARPERDWAAFLTQPKILCRVAPEQIASRATSIGAVVFLDSASREPVPRLIRLRPVEALHALAQHCLATAYERGTTLRALWAIVCAVPCSTLVCGDMGETASAIARHWPPMAVSRLPPVFPSRRATSG
jgi:predicted ATPase